MQFLGKKKYKESRQLFHQYFGKRIISHNHRGRRIDLALNVSNKAKSRWIYAGEIAVVAILGFVTLIFGNSTSLPNNSELVYPLDQVSTLECRTQTRSAMPEECKIQLPLIQGAKYANYVENKDYTDIYTVLFGGHYKDGWDIEKGSHYAVDIATARGTPLYAIANAKVYFAGEQAGYGKVVKIQFLYNGTMLFASYAHMDTIDVETGQTLSKGQKIGTVGNSGLTVGALGGYHVHFEINKGDRGRPIYPFYNCADSAKGGTAIINAGLCREEVFKYAYDPIVFLEGAQAKLPHSQKTPSNNQNSTHQNSSNQTEHTVAPETFPYLAQMRQDLIQIAKYYLQTPYALGGVGGNPGVATDCSRLVFDVFLGAGVNLNVRSAAEQAHLFTSGGFWYDKIDKAEPGDLLFFKNTYETSTTESDITHVGIALGNGLMLHAGVQQVEISSIDSYRKDHFKGVGSLKQFASKYNPEKAKLTVEKLEQLKADSEHPSAGVDPILPENTTPSQQSNIQLDFSNLGEQEKKFFMERDLQIEGEIPDRVKVGSTLELKLQLKNKKDGRKYDGILQQPITLIANTTAVGINPVAITLVPKGDLMVSLLAQKTGPIYIAINFGMKKIGQIQFIVH